MYCWNWRQKRSQEEGDYNTGENGSKKGETDVKATHLDPRLGQTTRLQDEGDPAKSTHATTLLTPKTTLELIMTDSHAHIRGGRGGDDGGGMVMKSVM